ncbi:hypothetical protein BU17DRAFT_89463 [Hysterangium stoloniferum]|nr:hypothetical protein BU17DRAFT_89463 [Hysterangium stoloniferum]
MTPHSPSLSVQSLFSCLPEVLLTSFTFALLIGVDEYQKKSISSLQIAVVDSKGKATLLVDRYDFGPQTLPNQQATREAIIAGIRGLGIDDRINHFDPILISYTVNGNVSVEPDAWHWDTEHHMIQTIVPHDTITDRDVIHNMISDRGLHDMLVGLAERKCCDITVILDCCHSNSDTRGIESEFVVRCAWLRRTLPEHLDRDVLNSTSAVYKPSLDSLYSGICSHILITACGRTEVAFESRECFKKALINILNDIDFGNATCTELLKLLPDLPLTIYRNILGSFKPIDITREDMILHPESGSIDTSNTSPEFLKRARGRLVQTTLRDEDKFKVHFSTSFTDEFVRCVEASTNHRIKCDTEVAANILVHIEDHKVTFTIQLRSLQHEERLSKTTDKDPSAISDVLLEAADFHWHLCRDVREERGISMDFFRVEQRTEASRGFRAIRRPVEPIENLISDGIIDITVHPQNTYGMKLTNNTDYDFYPYIYYFNVRSLKFDDLGHIFSSSPRRVDAPLPHGSEFTIGYGTTARNKLYFRNSSSLQMQYGFIKIFLTTWPLSTTPMTVSPFTTSTTRDLVVESEENDYWCTCLVKTVERYRTGVRSA